MHLLYCRQNIHDVKQSTSQKSNVTICTNEQQKQQQQNYATDIINQNISKSSPSNFNKPWYKRVFSFSSNVTSNDSDYENQQTDNYSQGHKKIYEDFTRPSDTVAAPNLHMSNGVRYIR